MVPDFGHKGTGYTRIPENVCLSATTTLHVSLNPNQDVSLCSCECFLLYRDWAAHATLVTYAALVTLAELDAIFQAFLALRPFEPRRSRGERCKPCPVALVPTIGCFRPPPPSLLLLRFALSASIIPGSVIMLNSKGSSFSRTRLPRKKKDEVSPSPRSLHSCLDEYAPARRETVGVYPCLHPCPPTHGKIRVKERADINRV